MRINIKFVTILFILCSGLLAGKGDVLFNTIESFLSKYRQSIETGDVIVRDGIIRLEIKGRRTNIKSQLLLGFYSVGRALQKSSTPFREVHIIIHFQLKEQQEQFVSAPAELVLKLSQGKLSSEHFFDIISN